MTARLTAAAAAILAAVREDRLTAGMQREYRASCVEAGPDVVASLEVVVPVSEIDGPAHPVGPERAAWDGTAPDMVRGHDDTGDPVLADARQRDEKYGADWEREAADERAQASIADALDTDAAGEDER